MRVLHAGCGGSKLPDWLQGFEEVRLDINADEKPDVVASIVDLGDIGPFEAVYSSHTLEHLYPHEVPVALSEFMRVLKDGGKCVLVVPDLEDLMISDRVLFISDGGDKICALDMIYGHHESIPYNPHMAHHSGFTAELLSEAMKAAGFMVEAVKRSNYNIVAIGKK